MPLSGLVSFFFHVKSSVSLRLFFLGFYFRKIKVAFQVVTHTLLFGHFGLSSCLLNTHTRNIKTEITTTKQVVYTHKHVLKKKKRKEKSHNYCCSSFFSAGTLTADGWGLETPSSTCPILRSTSSVISCLSSSTCSPISGMELSITCGDDKTRQVS